MRFHSTFATLRLGPCRWIDFPALLIGTALLGIAMPQLMAAPPTVPRAAGTSLSELPVRELAVFKDGHAFVVHQGLANVSDQGTVTLDSLPAPVIGTFWPYSANKDLPLRSVVAGQRAVSVKKTALTPIEMIKANIGKRILVHEKEEDWSATILSIPTRTAEELERTTGPGANESTLLPQESPCVLLQTDAGQQLVPPSRLERLTFVDAPETTFESTEVRNLLTMNLDLPAAAPQQTEVGMTYLQKGIRWIPQYRVNLNQDGVAEVELQATLLNEMLDVDDATVHLIVGVPSFAFCQMVSS